MENRLTCSNCGKEVIRISKTTIKPTCNCWDDKQSSKSKEVEND